MARRGKKRSLHGLEEKEEMVTVGDISVAKTLVPLDYEPSLNDKLTTEMLYKVLSTPESTLVFCARQRWIDVKRDLLSSLLRVT